MQTQYTFLSSGCFLAALRAGQLQDESPARPQWLVMRDLERYCRTAPRLLLCLDYDGTLVPITARPEDARPTPAVLDLLTRLASTPRIMLAIVSGRPVVELSTLLPVSGLTLIGTHGLEIRAPNGSVSQMLPTGAFMLAMARVQREIRQLIRGKDGFILEDKRQALTLHYRLADPQEAAQTVSRVQAILRRYQRNGVALEILHGKKVVEIRPVGVNKGKAVAALLQQAGSTVFPIYMGDDTTDEDAFRVLADRGLSILVSDVARPTSAHYYLEDPREVYKLLEQVLTCLVHTSERNSPARQSPPLQPNDEAFVPCHPVRARGT